MRIFGRCLLMLVSLLLIVVIGYVVVLGVKYDFTYAYRVLYFGDSGIDDYKVFPTRPIPNKEPAFYFKKAVKPLEIDKIRYSYNGKEIETDLESMINQSLTVAVLVIRDDTILFEKYSNGYARDSLISCFSVSKSITSSLIGRAIADGYIRSIDDPVINYLPELKGKGLDTLTIRHLLTMGSGIPYCQPKGAFVLAQPFYDDALNYYMPDLRAFALDMKAGEDPINAYYMYNNHHPLFEGIILERVTGRTVSEYMSEKIWSMIGAEYPASWNLDSKRSGFEHMESGFNACAIDFAKFARLFLNNGFWEGRQVLPESWVIDSISPDPFDKRPWKNNQEWEQEGGYYKYHWWGIQNKDGSYDYAALGHLGQVIYIRPRDKSMALRFGMKGSSREWAYIMRAILDQTEKK